VSDIASDFYRQNEWANLLVVPTCRELTEEQLDATAVGTFGSIRDTLHHIVGSEGGYAYRLGHEPVERLRPGDPWPGFDVLVKMITANAEALAAASGDAGDRTVGVGSEDDPYNVEASVVLVQAFNHSTEHRSQISTILTTPGIEPPEMSGWDRGLAVGRMREA
jgi:uncharacterized damage-inducible protein DinB